MYGNDGQLLLHGLYPLDLKIFEFLFPQKESFNFSDEFVLTR